MDNQAIEIIVLSDIHGDLETSLEVVRNHLWADYFLFLGDGDREFIKLASLFPALLFLGVRGNNDYILQAYDLYVTIQTKQIYMTHGHRNMAVKKDLSLLKQMAVQEKLDLILYGHTHQADIIKHDKTIIMNPGAIVSYGRIHPSYGRIILEAGVLYPEILYL